MQDVDYPYMPINLPTWPVQKTEVLAEGQWIIIINNMIVAAVLYNLGMCLSVCMCMSITCYIALDLVKPFFLYLLIKTL